MRIPIYRRLFGYYRVSVPPKDATRLQNVIFKAGLIAYSTDVGVFYLPRLQKDPLLKAAAKEKVSVTVGELLGAPRVIRQNWHRVGIPIGILGIVLLLFWGTHTVWRVEISGNEAVASEQIEQGLSDLGFGVGTFLGKDEYDALSAEYRLLHPEIAWMGIYTEGTVAHVRVIENKEENDSSLSPLPSHLIASRDAVILRTDIQHGTAVVDVGSVVKKGDVLALGVMKGAHRDQILAAEGSVLGRVKEEIVVEIPEQIPEKKEIGRKKGMVTVNFFQKDINIFKKTYKTSSDYVIIKRKEMFSLFGRCPLPFGYTVTEYVFYESSSQKTEFKDALLLAKEEMNAKIKEIVGEGEILSRQTAVEQKEGTWVLRVAVEYTKNIAERLPFGVDS